MLYRVGPNEALLKKNIPRGRPNAPIYPYVLWWKLHLSWKKLKQDFGIVLTKIKWVSHSWWKGLKEEAGTLRWSYGEFQWQRIADTNNIPYNATLVWSMHSLIRVCRHGGCRKSEENWQASLPGSMIWLVSRLWKVMSECVTVHKCRFLGEGGGLDAPKHSIICGLCEVNRIRKTN